MIALTKFKKEDYERLIQWVDTEELMVLFSGPIFNFPITYEQLNIYTSDNSKLIYKVIDTKTNQVIGHAELGSISLKNKSARICRVLVGKNSHRNKGYGKLIIKELINISFNELNLHRLDLGVYDFNHAAIKCYKNCGFTIEGLLKDNVKVNDEYWSTYNMSILNNKNH
ncbi:GNAT family protein [Tenacibaculum sp.]|nr:GNAT family protein [Tenacibaculum sp.]